MKRIVTACALCVLVLMPASVWAAHPFEVEQTDTRGKGNVLLELNGDHRRDDESRTTKLRGVITVGAGEETDLSLDVPYLLLDPSPKTTRYERGVADFRLQVKHRMFENEVKQSLGFIVYSDVPTGYHDDRIRNRDVRWGAAITDQQGCCDTILRAGVGYEVLGRGIKHSRYADDYAIRFGFAVEQKIAESFRFLSEFAGESRKTAVREADSPAYSRPFTVMAGVLYDLSRSWYVDLGARAGLNKYAEDYSVLAGTAWRF